jgi:hypothetical protein
MTDTNVPITPTPMFTASIKSRFWVKRRGKDRMRQAIALREQGLTYQAIADNLGYGNRAAVWCAVNDSAFAREMARKGAPEARSAIVGRKMTHDTPTHATTGRTGEMSDAERRAA